MTDVKSFASFFLAAALFAGDSDFNGRWNLTVSGSDPRARAWWLEIEGAGSKKPSGKFVGAPGGQMDEIPEIRVSRGELEFAFEKKYRLGPAELHEKVRRGVYRARIVNDKLVGTFSLDGNVVGQFTGARAPDIRDRDDSSWKPAGPVALFNGKDLSGWTLPGGGPVEGWSVRDGLLVNSPNAPDIVSKEKFWNFELLAEFRIGPKSNSGIGLRDRYEIQIFDTHGRKPDTHSMGALYSRIAPSVDAANPPGEWQTMHIRLVGRTLTVKLNGKTVIDRREVEGLTAMAHDPNEAMPGPFSLQGDHGIVEFRTLTVTPLTH